MTQAAREEVTGSLRTVRSALSLLESGARGASIARAGHHFTRIDVTPVAAAVGERNVWKYFLGEDVVDIDAIAQGRNAGPGK